MMVCLYRELFPSSRCLFVYRDVEKVAKSVYRTTLVAPSVYLIMKLGKLSGYLIKILLDSMGLNGSDFCIRADNDLALGTVLSAVVTSIYLDLRRRGLDISAVCYEDLVARPLEMLSLIHI